MNVCEILFWWWMLDMLSGMVFRYFHGWLLIWKRMAWVGAIFQPGLFSAVFLLSLLVVIMVVVAFDGFVFFMWFSERFDWAWKWLVSLLFVAIIACLLAVKDKKDWLLSLVDVGCQWDGLCFCFSWMGMLISKVLDSAGWRVVCRTGWRPCKSVLFVRGSIRLFAKVA